MFDYRIKSLCICTANLYYFGFQVDNFIHADMHPGNILVRVSRQKAPSKGMFKLKPHVIFLDVGMTAELSNKDRLTLLEFFKAVALRDGRTAAECTLRLSKQQKCPSPEAFVQVLFCPLCYSSKKKKGIFVKILLEYQSYLACFCKISPHSYAKTYHLRFIFTLFIFNN